MNNDAREKESFPYALWLIPIAMLLLALADLPYGYYTLLRIIVCGCCGFLAGVEWLIKKQASFWVIALGMAAVLFNPFIPVKFGRDIWAFLDPATAALLATHLFRWKR